jgi:hypothetical protein
MKNQDTQETAGGGSPLPSTSGSTPGADIATVDIFGLRILMPLHHLQFAAEKHPEFWDGESGDDAPNIVVTDKEKFGEAVCEEINREDEDGSTLLTRMLDEAIRQAVENGCEGVDLESL